MQYTPMEFGLKLSKTTEEEDIDEKEYRRNIGCLGIYYIPDQILRFVLDY